MPLYHQNRVLEADGSMTTTNYIDDTVVSEYHKSVTVKSKHQRSISHIPRDSKKLAGPKETLEWARRQHQFLITKIRETSTPEWLKLKCEINPQTGNADFTVQIQELPFELGHMFIATAHSIRSAFDQLVAALVEANGNTVGRGNRFPVWEEGEFKQSGFEKDLKGVSASARHVIERTLRIPDLRGRLNHLHKLDIGYKQHKPIVVAAAEGSLQAKVGLPGIFLSPEGSICFGGGAAPYLVDVGEPVRGNIFPLVDGAVIHTTPAGFIEELNLNYVFAIGPSHLGEGVDITQAISCWLTDLDYLIFRCERLAM